MVSFNGFTENFLLNSFTYFANLHEKKQYFIEINTSVLKHILIKSITYDNGLEFSKHEKINKTLNIKSYFCKPYHSWEKGTVKNINGLIRRFFPKGTNFDNISKKELKYVEDWINNRPMKILGFKTPNEKFNEIIKIC